MGRWPEKESRVVRSIGKPKQSGGLEIQVEHHTCAGSGKILSLGKGSSGSDWFGASATIGGYFGHWLWTFMLGSVWLKNWGR